ncbi:MULTISPECIES: hypothetical protein [Streptomyces]|uniref:hypothetical protein n=1 Tax=Streptomyces TaxID=1883 RepID=UPI0011D1D4CC|nr:MULTISPECIES: hypothetical protein [Streptomyces]
MGERKAPGQPPRGNKDTLHAYTWSSWGDLSDAYPSFAALVVEQRQAWEAECGRAGRPVRPEGVDELVAEGRALALRGEADAALVVFGRAADKGGGHRTVPAGNS